MKRQILGYFVEYFFSGQSSNIGIKISNLCDIETWRSDIKVIPESDEVWN